MEEELSSIWTVLIRAGLSAALQAKRFNSSVAEEKHICHKSLGLPDGGGGFWSEILGWWGYGVRWLLPSLALRAVGSWCPSEDYRQKKKKKITALHCSMPRWCSKRDLAGSHLRTRAPQFILPKLWAKRDLHPKPPCANVLHAFRTEVSRVIVPDSEIIWQICVFN